MGITIPSNSKLTAGKILCALSIGMVVFILVANYYLPDSISDSFNFLGIPATFMLCLARPLYVQGKEEQRADFNLALQQKLQPQGTDPGLGIDFEEPTTATPAQFQDPQFFQTVDQLAKESPYLQATASDEVTPSEFVTCPACGKHNDAGNAFCNHCGAKIR